MIFACELLQSNVQMDSCCSVAAT